MSNKMRINLTPFLSTTKTHFHLHTSLCFSTGAKKKREAEDETQSNLYLSDQK